MRWEKLKFLKYQCADAAVKNRTVPPFFSFGCSVGEVRSISIKRFQRKGLEKFK